MAATDGRGPRRDPKGFLSGKGRFGPGDACLREDNPRGLRFALAVSRLARARLGVARRPCPVTARPPEDARILSPPILPQVVFVAIVVVDQISWAPMGTGNFRPESIQLKGTASSSSRTVD